MRRRFLAADGQGGGAVEIAADAQIAALLVFTAIVGVFTNNVRRRFANYDG